ncbi:hypothetical protein FH508_0004030 [Lysinibacillus sp. CD3-6]|uniref:DUF7669 domain-containing protein n=1 Tax=Lysinibacillus sp. CD3-6 TaxID=2892541 RepID=UPI0011733339|nr:hypothetical protein [Lysinibacillus sp. CD3-6]UED81068.1 hypothetical protein FH508_0004030 [Lysinibacillus sp. CD3-6]
MLTEKITCRDELLNAFKNLIASTGKKEFSIQEIKDYMLRNGSISTEKTIEAHVRYRCCANAKKRYHATNYDDLIRLESGLYSLFTR